MPPRAQRPRASRRSLAIVIGSFIVLLIILGSMATVYTDLLWFKETKFQTVFYTQLWTKTMLGLSFGALFAAVLLVNLWVVQKITSPYRLFTMQDQVLERYRATLQPYVRVGVIGISLLFGLFAGSGATSQWRSWLLFSHSQRFGSIDPIFHKDIGFYIFKLPFERFVFTWAFSSLLVITIVVGVAHYFMGGIRTTGERVTPQVKAHLSVLLGGLVLLKAWGYRLDQFGLLYSPRGTVTGASYTDVHAQLPAMKLLVVIALVSAVLFLINIRLRGWIMPAAAIGILALTSILAGGVFPALVQRLSVTPQERLRERPYIERNIKATRTAFKLDESTVKVKEFSAAHALDAKDIENNRTTVENIRLWSPDVLKATYTQLQRITPYYEFLDVDVDRYPAIGGLPARQVMLSPREVSQNGLPQSARTWLNNHLVYTHGFGVVASRVDRVVGEGLPDFIVKDIPGTVSQNAPKIDQPRIYFGESEEVPFVLVNTKELEVDYPSSDGLKTTNYAGTGGIQMQNFLRRTAFAWRFRDFNVLISGAIKGDSRLIFRRKIRDRVTQVAPFLKLDFDPYIAVVDGRLTWIQDAYTTTDMYPYSERVNLADPTGPTHLRGTANYIRNSVKVTIDALNGTISLYVFDPKDPVIRAWQDIWPDIFKPASAMSASLREHLRYPEDLFTVQANQYTLYHITNPDDFYQREDAWRVPRDPRPKIGDEPFPAYYVLMRLPDEKEAEFMLMLPFAPFSQTSGGTRRTNMTAWLAARSDPADYGEMRSFVFPRQENIPGPEQIQARINQDPNVSQQITLWNQSNSVVTYGNILVIPIEDSLLYVQPLYLEASEGALPELKRVVVVAGDVVKMGETLQDALDAVFGKGTGAVIEKPGTVTPGSPLIAQALQHLRNADTALRNGDLATYQKEVNAAKAALEQANQPSPTPTPK
jgi:uncharacterized membrane protein (UPF0182 family)